MFSLEIPIYNGNQIPWSSPKSLNDQCLRHQSGARETSMSTCDPGDKRILIKLFSIQKGISPELVCCPRCSCRWWSSCWCCSWWGGWTHPQLWCSRCCICWTRTWRLLDRLEVSIPTTWQGHHRRGRFWEGWHWSPARRGADQISYLSKARLSIRRSKTTYFDHITVNEIGPGDISLNNEGAGLRNLAPLVHHLSRTQVEM